MAGHKSSVAAQRRKPVKDQKRPSHRNIFSDSIWRAAILAAAGTLGSASYAEAAFFSSEPDPADITSSIHRQRHKSRRNHEATREKNREAPEKEAAKPQGPLFITISIDRQRMKIYDAKGFFAETPISTGMRGHPTPMGVFSVIEKDRYHHSNIYSGAPMPFMQRITWSGVAIHAGVLPGYPASHGCIRMPMAFAMKMWNWTKMGARVVVTPGEMTPASFSHPLLVTTKILPPPVMADAAKADSPVPAKTDKGSNPEVQADAVKPLMNPAPASLREQTHTADASNALPVGKAPATMSDASPPSHADNAGPAVTPTEAIKPDVAKSEPEPAKADHAAVAEKTAESKSSDTPVSDSAPSAVNVTETKPSETPAPAGETAKVAVTAGENVKADEAKVEPKANEVNSAEAKAVEAKPVDSNALEAKPAEAKPAEAKPAEIKTVEIKTAETKTPDTASTPQTPEAKATDVKTEAANPVAATTGQAAEKPAEAPKAVATGAPATDPKKDQARLQDNSKEAKEAKKALAIAARQRGGQIAVFISRKDSKLYVRQSFLPLFDVPVTIAPSDRPLGTHVFTAEAEKDDANQLRWSVVTLPTNTRNVEHRDDDERPSRKRKAQVVEAKPAPIPDSPAEALDRVSIPEDAMARITPLLSTGGSIVISDQGINAGETGEGTDFIVSLR